MPKVSKDTASGKIALDGLNVWQEHFDGGYSVCFESHKADADLAPLFRGLPDDRCQCPHWGVVQSGQITFRWADHEETYGAGDAYYAPPGHLPLIAAGTSVVEFSPTAGLRETMAVVEANLARAEGVS